MENGMTYEGPDVARLEEWFISAEEASMDARKKAERDRDYRDGKQLTAEEISALKKRGQPPIVINRIKRNIDWLMGFERRQRSDPKAYPRTPMHDEAAEVATDCLRYVADNADYDDARSVAFEHKIIEGIGAFQVTTEEGPQGPEIVFDPIPFDRFFYDPHSSKPDFSDAKYLGMVIWKDEEDALQQYGEEFKGEISGLFQREGDADTYDDKPKQRLWTDKARKRLRVVQIWYATPQGWAFCEFSSGVKFNGGLSPYQDEQGRPDHPIVARSAYIDRENNRYGIVREMIDPQDEINKRRSKALHLLNSRQVRMSSDAVEDTAEMKRELSKPDGVVKTNPGSEWEMINNADLTAGQASLLQEAKSEIDMMGPNASLQGKEGRALSGRAMQAQQEGGVIELGPIMDSLRSMDREGFRKAWLLIRQTWTAERYIRVTDDEQKVSFVGLNEPQFDQFGRFAGLQNPVAEMDMDILIEDAPDMVTLAGEQFEMFSQALPVLAQLPPNMQEIYLEMIPNLRNKRRIIEILKGGDNPEAQAQAQQMQAMQAQMQMQGAQAELENTQADTQKKRADALKAITQAAAEGANAATPHLQ
jgi:hypothetical protein